MSLLKIALSINSFIIVIMASKKIISSVKIIAILNRRGGSYFASSTKDYEVY